MRILSILFILILIAFFTLGIISKQIEYTITLKVQAPIKKAYDAFASHEFKSLQYPNINPKTAKVEAFLEGNTTFLEYTERNKKKSISETVVQLDSLQYLELSINGNNSLTTSSLHFTDKQLITKIRIEEKLQGNTAIQRSMIYLFQQAIKRNREEIYNKLKTHIESTPDFDFRPEEQK